MGDEIEIYYPNKSKPIIIDYQDYHLWSKYPWNWTEGSVYTSYPKYDKLSKEAKEAGCKPVLLHNLILDLPKNVHEQSGLVIDHINGNPLDNRRSNLRLCTQQQNCFNQKKQSTYSGFPTTSKYKGVLYRNDSGKRKKKWRASIRFNGRLIHIGSFLTEIEAAKAYNIKAKELFGEYAKLNFQETSSLER